MKLELKAKAIKLRRQGKTFTEIQKLIGPVSKSSLSLWLKPVELTKEQKHRILKKMASRSDLGRQKGGFTNHQNRINRIVNLQAIANSEFEKLTNKPIFIPGLVLYLAEGSRKYERFQFMNSDPRLIKLMIKWLRVLNISIADIQARLYIHHVYANENCENFWARMTNIPLSQFSKTIYKPTVYLLKKNPSYKGCLRVEVRGSELFWKVVKWGDMVNKFLKV